jgi:hypothetical protein
MREGDVIEARAGHVAVARAGDEDRRVEVTPLVAVAWGRASGTAAVGGTGRRAPVRGEESTFEPAASEVSCP